MILLICTLDSRGSTGKPLPWFLNQQSFRWHVLNADTIPAKRPAEPEKKEDVQKQDAETKPVQELNEAAGAKTGEVVKTIKEVPKSKKQPKPVAVQTPKLPVKVPVIKTPKVIRKIKL
ncbi:MAG: hypothetical protein J7578_21590 [Chitinophagaceae bacterium]|nr:hypothetical protein [Chitinophagaceae bacterium]